MGLPPDFDMCGRCKENRAAHYPGVNLGACDHFEKAEPSHTFREILPRECIEGLPRPNVHVGNRPTPLPYIPPKLEKLSLEERLIEHAAKWHQVQTRLRILDKRFEEITENLEDDAFLLEMKRIYESFYDFCVTLMKG